MKITKKVVAILMLISILFSSFSNLVYATEINEADLEDRGDCEQHLQFWDDDNNCWSYVITTFVTYNENGVDHPAYCLDPHAQGVREYGEYSVDVSSVLDDDRIWRVIKNGYPYKTPEEMGVYDEDDAFVATKQAVYSIIYDYDPEEKYQGADDRGDDIAAAIVNLVDIGRYGTETPYNSGITSNKIGGLVKDGDYYSQEYSIVCGVTASQYKIIDITGMPEGAIITDLNNNSKTIFNGSEHFKIKIPAAKMNEDINISFRIQAKAATYPIFYGESDIEGTQDYALTYDPFGDVTGVGTLSLEALSGGLQVKKVDKDTGEPISGVVFQLEKTDGTVVATATSNGSGIAEFTDIIPDNYVLREVSVNNNYNMSNETYNVTINSNSISKVEVTNEYKKGQIKIIKVDKDDNEVKLAGVEFQIIDENGNIVDTVETNSEGVAISKKLRINHTYKIKETKGLTNYVLDETEQTITITDEGIKTIRFVNEAKKGKIKVIKVDKDDNEVKLKGVEFKIYDESNQLVDNIITDENGEATSKSLRIDTEYTIKESKTLSNYILNDEEKTVVLKQDEITTVTFENELKKGKVKVIKVDEDFNEIKLKGVEFKIYDEDNKLVDTLITDENGEAISKDLRIDKKYIVEETKTLENYILNEEPQKVTLKQDEITTITFENEHKKGNLSILKVDKDNHRIFLGNVKFDLYSEEFEKVIGTYTTSVDGEIHIKNLRVRRL